LTSRGLLGKLGRAETALARQAWSAPRKEAAVFRKILLAYNGSREGKSALLACAEIASFAKSETHLLAVAGMPSSMFLTEGFLPEELLEEEKKRAQEVLSEGIDQLKQKGFSVSGRGDLPARRRAQMRSHRRRSPAEGLVRIALVARVGRQDAARSRALQHLRRADPELGLPRLV
jgi:hypothetical protein